LATPEAIGLDENSGTSDAKTFGTLVGGVFDVAVQSPYKRSHRGSDVLVLQMSRLVGGRAIWISGRHAATATRRERCV
jgi:hypothetical protein